MLWIRINDGAEYATSGTLSLTFPGLVADRVEVAETDDFSGATSCDPESTVVFSLSSLEQGLRPLYGRTFRGAPPQESGPLIIGSVILDTEAPVLAVTEPGHQSTTADPAVHVRGTVSDAGGPIRVWVNQKPVHGVDHGAFWLADYPLAPGENQLVVVAADAAGNESQQILTVTRNPAGDSTPPTVDFNLPANPTRVGDIEFLDILGTTDDPYASVEYTVTGVSGTTGPHAAHVVNGWMYTQIPLQPGENTVSVTARDAAGNEAQLQYAVIRSEGVAFHIDSPEYFHVQHGPTLGVGGIAPNDFTDITANGAPVGVSYPGGHISFGDTVSITPDLNLIRIRAVDSQDRIWYDQLVAIGYEILSYSNEFQQPHFGKEFYADGGYLKWREDPNGSRWTWDASSLALHNVDESFPSSTKFTPPDVFVVQEGPLERWDVTYESVFTPPSHGGFETGSSVSAYREDPPEELLGGGVWETLHEDTSLRFRKFFPEGGTQFVVLHFEGMDYHRKPGESAEPDPSQITLFDNPGFWYAGDQIGFLVEIENGQEYAINRDAFTWPGFNYLLPHTHQSLAVTRQQGARLSYSEWGNDTLKVDFIDKYGNPTEELKISKWVGAFSGNPPTLNSGFIENDPDRFQVRLSGLNAGDPTVSMYLSSNHGSTTTWDDDETEITLYHSSSGTYISKTMILVSNSIDDDEVHQGTNGHISGASDNSTDDRTHLATLGSEVRARVTYAGVELDDTADVIKKKEATVHIRIVPDASGIAPITITEAIALLFTTAKETYRQIGLELLLDSDIHVVLLNPEDIDWNHGFDVLSGSTQSGLDPDAETMVNRFGTSTTDDDIHIFLVPAPMYKLKFQSNPLAGVTTIPSAGVDAGYLWNVFIDAGTGKQSTIWTLAHELGHVLGKDGHDSDPWLLMRGGGTSSSNSDISDSKRISITDGAVFLGSPHAH